MSIASAIQDAQTKIAAAYSAVASKGASLPETQDLFHLSGAIQGIAGSGGVPNSFLRKNNIGGTYMDDGTAVRFSVNGATTLAAYSLYYAFWKNKQLVEVDLSTIEDLSITNYGSIGQDGLWHVTQIGTTYALNYAFAESGVSGMIDLSKLKRVSLQTGVFISCENVTGVNLSNLERISSCDRWFWGCRKLTTVIWNPLMTTIDADGLQNMFRNTGLTNTDFLSNITKVGNMFNTGGSCYQTFCQCEHLERLNLHNLTDIGENGFGTPTYGDLEAICSSCPELVEVDFTNLSGIYCPYALRFAFSNCTKLQTLSFPSVKTTSFGSKTNQFTDMCRGISGITIHFPSNVRSTIEGLNGYSTTAPFGATSGTVLFDLDPTE